jgi:hypothetical protein
VRIGEREVTLQQRADVVGSGVVNRDVAFRHCRHLQLGLRTSSAGIAVVGRSRGWPNGSAA